MQLLRLQCEQPRAPRRLRRLIELDRAPIAATRSSSTAPNPLAKPRLFASAARAARSASRKLRREPQARSSVSRYAGSPVCRCASPRPISASQRSTVSPVRAARARRRTAARASPGREAVERPLARPAGVARRLGLVDRHGRSRQCSASSARRSSGSPPDSSSSASATLLVDPRPAGPAEPVVEGVVDQRVREGEPPDVSRRFASSDASTAASSWSRSSPLLGLDECREQLEVEAAADHRRRVSAWRASVAEPLRPAARRPRARSRAARRPRAAVDVPAAASSSNTTVPDSDEVAQDLADEERVPARLGRDLAASAIPSASARGRRRRHHLPRPPRHRALQREPLARLRAGADRRARRSADGPWSRSESRYVTSSCSGRARAARDVLEQRHRLRVRPLEVVEHDAQRHRPCHRAQQPGTAENSRKRSVSGSEACGAGAVRHPAGEVPAPAGRPRRRDAPRAGEQSRGHAPRAASRPRSTAHTAPPSPRCTRPNTPRTRPRARRAPRRPPAGSCRSPARPTAAPPAAHPTARRLRAPLEQPALGLAPDIRDPRHPPQRLGQRPPPATPACSDRAAPTAPRTPPPAPGTPSTRARPTDSNRAPSTRPREHPHRRRDEDPVRRRLLAQPRRLDRRHPEVVPVLDRRLAGPQADPDVHLLLRAAVAPLEQLLHQHRASDRRRRRRERHDQPVAGVLDLAAAGRPIASRSSSKYSSRSSSARAGPTRRQPRRPDQIGQPDRRQLNRLGQTAPIVGSRRRQSTRPPRAPERALAADPTNCPPDPTPGRSRDPGGFGRWDHELDDGQPRQQATPTEGSRWKRTSVTIIATRLKGSSVIRRAGTSSGARLCRYSRRLERSPTSTTESSRSHSAQTEVLPAPHGKDVDVQIVVDLRRMLKQAGFAPEGAPAVADQSARDHGDGQWGEPT